MGSTAAEKAAKAPPQNAAKFLFTESAVKATHHTAEVFDFLREGVEVRARTFQAD